MEDATAQNDVTPAAKQDAAAIMAEFVTPLEALNNLLYLLQVPEMDAAITSTHLEMAQAELLKINEITKKGAAFHRLRVSVLRTFLEEELWTRLCSAAHVGIFGRYLREWLISLLRAQGVKRHRVLKGSLTSGQPLQLG